MYVIHISNTDCGSAWFLAPNKWTVYYPHCSRYKTEKTAKNAIKRLTSRYPEMIMTVEQVESEVY